MDKLRIMPEKFIFASTISVYGENYFTEKYDEEYSPHPKSPYALTKFEAENFLLNNFSKNSWILRFAPVYSDNFLLNINRRIKINKLFYRVGGGNKKLTLCNLENISTSINAIISNRVPSGVMNISDRQYYTYNDLLSSQRAKNILFLPKIVLKLIYFFGKMFDINYLRENSIKLLTNNKYPSKKINRFIKLDKVLKPNNFSTKK